MDHQSQYSSTITDGHRSLECSILSCAGPSFWAGNLNHDHCHTSIYMDDPNQFSLTVTDSHHDSSLEMSGSTGVIRCDALHSGFRARAEPETEFWFEYNEVHPSGTLVRPNSYMNSYKLWIHMIFEFICLWIHIWIHIHEFKDMNSYDNYMNSYMKWLYEFIYI